MGFEIDKHCSCTWVKWSSNLLNFALAQSIVEYITMNTSKKLYILCLLAAFWYSIITSYLFILEEPTSFGETEIAFAASFPSLTICRRQWETDDLITFLDAMQEIRKFHRMVEATLIHAGKNIEM